MQRIRLREHAARQAVRAVAQLMQAALRLLSQAADALHIHIRQECRGREQSQQDAERAPCRAGQMQTDIRDIERQHACEHERRAERRKAAVRQTERNPEPSEHAAEHAVTVHHDEVRRLRDEHRADKGRRFFVNEIRRCVQQLCAAVVQHIPACGESGNPCRETAHACGRHEKRRYPRHEAEQIKRAVPP